MDIKIIAAIQKAGFDVYMRRTTDSYLQFTDGKNIGYLQDSGGGGGGISMTTVHVPNHASGTGYRIMENMDLSDITKENLIKAFVMAPSWARSGELSSVRKWKDIGAFISADDFNKEYALVTPQ